MSSRLAWFTSINGRRVIGTLATVASCATFGVSYVPQTLCLEQYHDFMTLRKFNESIPVSQQLQKLWSEVLDDLNLNQLRHITTRPFTIFGFDIWHAGSLKTNYGSIIGLPINFEYTDITAIDKSNILLKNEPINWNREDSKQFIKSLILSDKAKKYAMAREILMTNNSNIVIGSITNAALLGSAYIFGAQINDSMSMFQKPRATRILFYAVCGAFFWGIWAMQRDAITTTCEKEVDEHLSQLGVNYIQGAIEFYEKLLQRNIALRTLDGSIGERIFTKNGDENYLIRQKSLPITYRKNFFEEKLKALETSIDTDHTQ